MRKIVLTLIAIGVGALMLSGTGLAYQVQGFEKREEKADGITFICKQQCIVNLGTKGINNLFSLNKLEGEGSITIGANSNNQIIPLSTSNIKNGVAKNYITNYGGQPIPDAAQLVMIIQGDISTSSAKLDISRANVIDKIGFGWKEFWKNEGQTFYGINLRYGQMIGGTSVVVYGYRLFIIGLLALLIKGNLTLRNTIYLGLTLYLILAIRNQIDYTKTTLSGLQNYSYAAEGSKQYGDLGDFYEFITTIEKKITKKECKIYYECQQERPYCAHMQTVFLKPCEMVKNPQDSDYQLFYKKSPSNPLGEKLVEFNNSFLYKTK